MLYIEASLASFLHRMSLLFSLVSNTRLTSLRSQSLSLPGEMTLKLYTVENKMSIPPNSLWRGCAANFPQPVDEDDVRAAQFLVETVYYFNCHIADPPLADIEYRSSSEEGDILCHVFRWDLTPYQEVFQHGFQARRQDNTPDDVYYNLAHYNRHGGRPLDSRRPTTHAFISTTLDSAWHPTVNETVSEVCRYEIYVPGGIWVAQTLGDHNAENPDVDEVCFVAGIAPQYIRSAQRFKLTSGGPRERLDDILGVNKNFNPQSHPPRLLNIRGPIFDHQNTNNTSEPLTIRIYQPSVRDKREANSTTTTDWYAANVANCGSYITAAFRSSRANEAYLFMKNEHLLLNYASDVPDDKVLPLLIGNGYLSLLGKAFAEHGIDCAFGSHDGDEAVLFSGNLCAPISYSPGTLKGLITRAPRTITAVFPFLKKTEFKSSIDAAFESTRKYEAYLFKEDRYALINYGSDNPRIIHVKLIADGFPGLKNTIFKSGIDAAFASHRTDEAYLFKGDSCALFNTTNGNIIGGVKKIVSNWPSLQPILPRKNRGLEVVPKVDLEIKCSIL